MDFKDYIFNIKNNINVSFTQQKLIEYIQENKLNKNSNGLGEFQLNCSCRKYSFYFPCDNIIELINFYHKPDCIFKIRRF